MRESWYLYIVRVCQAATERGVQMGKWDIESATADDVLDDNHMGSSTHAQPARRIVGDIRTE